MVGRVIAVALLAVMPMTGALVVDAVSDERTARSALVTRDEDVAARVSARESGMLNEMRGLLRLLGTLEEVQTGDAAECSPVLQRALVGEARLVALAVFDAKSVLCRGDGSADRAPFLEEVVRAAGQGEGFVVGEAQWDDRIEDWVVPFALPVGPEAPTRVLAAALHLGSLRDRLAIIAAEAGVEVFVFSTAGVPLAGTTLLDEQEAGSLSTRAAGPETAWQEEIEGRTFLFRARPLDTDAEESRGHIVVGLPLGAVQVATRRLYLARLALGVVAVGFGTLLAIWMARATIRRPLAAVETAASRVAAGDLGARMDVPDAPRDFHELERSFNVMVTTMQDLERTRTDLFNHVSHQLRTPLTRLVLAQDLLRRSLGSGALEQAARHAETARRAATDLRDKTEKLDSLAHVLLAQRSDTYDRMDLDALQEDLRRTVERSGRNTARIRTEGTGAAHVQTVSLRRAVAELVENAVLHGEGEVEVVLSANKENVLISVHDQGPGLPAHVLAALQAPLLHGHAEDVAKTGFGIGFDIARSVALLLGGRLEAERVDGVNRVSLVLPRAR